MNIQSENELSETLLDLLVCPIDNGSLAYIATENVLYNPRIQKAYEIRDTIPIMLIEQAIDIDNDLHKEYLKKITRYTGQR